MDESSLQQEINVEEIPLIINDQFDELANLRNLIESAQQKAQTIIESSDNPDDKHHIFPLIKKNSIERIQKVQVDLAEVQLDLANAQQLGFAYQERLGKVTKLLFGIGTISIASNRAVIEKLKQKLDGNNDEPLDELTKNEVLNLVKQLKAQEDALQKQEALERRVQGQAEKDEEHDKLFQDSKQRDESQDEKLHNLSKKYQHLLICNWIAIGIAIVGFILALISLFIKN